ncbi:MAG: RNA polymerase subunit sigma-24 [Candidatus Marinimicrobia bacterium]|nr:RNA polymerase subunit sigma-24 [Candidatus Neomarinimicrobiota bacterium]
MNNKTLSDELLIKKFQNGDESSFEILVDKYKNRIYNFIYRYVNDVDLAQDLTQDTFLKLYTRKDTYKEIAKFSTWLYTIAQNLAFTEIRKKKRRKTYSASDLSFEDREFVFSDYKGANFNENIQTDSQNTSDIIRLCLSELSDEFKTMIIFRDFQELSYDVISNIMSVPVGTVKSRINRGRFKLLKLLKEKGYQK